MLLHLISPFFQLLIRRKTSVLLLNVMLKRSGVIDRMAVYPTRCKSTRHFTLLLYGGHAPFTIKAHRSRGAVRPDLRKVAVTGLLPTRVGWLAPYGPDFLGRPPDARLCGCGGWLSWTRDIRHRFLWARCIDRCFP